MAAEIQIQFSDDLVRYFAALSHDCNPLHMNAQYARRTPFGSIVVHGVAAVLKILGRHFGGEPFQLESISALFKKPLRSEEHTSELQSRQYLVCRLLLEKKK